MLGRLNGRGALMLALAWLAACAAARAELPADGWPQARHDARLTGRGAEPALVDPAIAWETPVGRFVEGEMVASGCDLYVPVQHDSVVRVNARGGQRPWLEAEPLPACGSFRQHPARLALSDAGDLTAAFASDGAVAAVQDDLCLIAIGCESYAIDNAAFPPGIDLPSELAPYVAWPLNRCTGAPMVVSDIPSPGDVRYRPDGPNGYWLGAWWTDDGLFRSELACLGENGNLGLHPSWPVSVRPDGIVEALDPADGRERWRWEAERQGFRIDIAGGASGTIVTATAPDGTLDAASGLIASLRQDGSLEWLVRRMDGTRGQAARDPATGNLFVAIVHAVASEVFERIASRTAAAISAYTTDVGAVPAGDELADALVPTHLRSMPLNPLTGLAMRFSASPSPGDYVYEPRPAGYRFAMWDGEGRPVSAWEDFAWVGPAAVDEGSVESLAPDGSRRWRIALGDRVDPSPLVIADDGSIVFWRSDGFVVALDPDDGSERWRFPLDRMRNDAAPALLPDGGIVLGNAVKLAVVDPPGSLRWLHEQPDAGWAPTTVTSDGIILATDEAGWLRAFRPDGAMAWERNLGGPFGAGLLTPALVHEGLIHVGRADGVVVTLAERSDGGTVGDPGGILRAWRTSSPSEARLEWSTAALPAVPGAHWHLRRMLGDPRATGELLLPHDATATMLVDAPPDGPLKFYLLAAADCGENESLR